MRIENKSRIVQLIDTTLRDGAQAPNISFSRKDKIYIVKLLSNAGIKLFEAGIPAMGISEQDDIRELIRLFPQCTFIAWCRANLDDIKSAHSCGCDAIHLSFPISSAHMDILKCSEKEILDKVQNLCQIASKYFSAVSVGAQDASRATPEFLVNFTRSAYNSGVTRVRLADTVGILSPVTTFNLINLLREEVPECPIEFHGHNDLGMATANTVTAFLAGAEFASVTINGIGERTGNAALEEVVVAIKQTTPLHINFETHAINHICKEVATITQQPIPATKPVTGEAIFLHESGIHCHGQLKNSEAYEPYSPQKTGHSPSQFVTGTHSGRAGIGAILKQKGIQLSPQEMSAFIEIVKSNALKSGKSLDSNDTVLLFNQHFPSYKNL
jgi:homocitrate synthase NifV